MFNAKQLFIFAVCLPLLGCPSQSTSDARNSTCQDQPSNSLESRNVQSVSLSEQSIKVEGLVSQDKQLGYSFDGRTGQTIKYQTDDEICTWVFSPDNQLLSTSQLPRDGKYVLQVSTPRGSRSFKLNISLESPQNQAQLNSAQNSSNPSSAISSAPTEQADPQKFIQEHYAALNERRYRFTWTNLAPEFKQKAGGFSGYTEWWDSVDKVQLSATRLVSRNGDRAIVDADLQYRMKDGSVVKDDRGRIYLQWNSEEKHWDIADKTAS